MLSFFSFFLFFLVKYFLKETLAPHWHSWPNNKWESKMCYIFHFKAFSQVHKLVTETLKPQCMRWFHLHKHWHSKEGKDPQGTPGFFFFFFFQRFFKEVISSQYSIGLLGWVCVCVCVCVCVWVGWVLGEFFLISKWVDSDGKMLSLF